MSWHSLAPRKLSRSSGGATVAVQQHALTFRLVPDILAQTGWTPGDRLDVQCGDGEHFGMVRLVKDRTGWSLLAQGGKNHREQYVILRINKNLGGKNSLPEMPERMQMTPVPVQIRDGGVELRLPWVSISVGEDSPVNGSRAFARHTVKARDGGAIKLNRPATYVAPASTTGGA